MCDDMCCGTCRFHRRDDYGDWICVNDLGKYYADYTEYMDYCSDYEDRV